MAVARKLFAGKTAAIEATDSQLRYRLVDFQIKQATAAVQIAAGPDPNVNAVDMVVLPSLTRASVAHNLTEVMGSKAQPLVETFARLEKGAWSLVDFLTPAQEADLCRLRPVIGCGNVSQWEKKTGVEPPMSENSLLEQITATYGQSSSSSGK